MEFIKSEILAREALEIMPGPHSNLPGYELIKPVYITHGKGAHVYDVDGNDYIDYICGAGSGILGYGNQEYLQNIKEQIDKIYFLENCRRNPLEIELARKLIKYIPSAEKVRYLLSGTEAVQLAIRLSRAYTKRNLFIRFDGHYHGWLDNVLGGNPSTNLDAPPYGFEKPEDIFKTYGRDTHSLEQSFKIIWNDIDFLEKVLEKYGDKIAMIIMEPVNCNGGCCWPKKGYLERVRQLCDKYGIVLCFDEIITGFRMGLGGAQKLLGVTPDISTFGKGIAGGIPFSAVVGKSKIMDLLYQRKVIGAGTFNAYPLGMAAAVSTINILEKNNGEFYRNCEEKQKMLVDGLKNISKKLGIKMLIQAVSGCLFFQFTDIDIANNMGEWFCCSDHEKQERFRKGLFEEGLFILFRGRWYVSGALKDNDIERTLKAVEKVMKSIS